jgi:hypothetical protein
MKRPFPFVWISPSSVADIFQSTNNVSGKVACVHGPAAAQDSQEVLPWTIGNAVAIIFL